MAEDRHTAGAAPAAGGIGIFGGGGARPGGGRAERRGGRGARGAPVPAGGPRGSAQRGGFSARAHIQFLNAEWRGKDKPTNVLSFPAFPLSVGDPLPPLLGDVVLAAETVAREAALEDKPLENHISHLVIHGLLHLLGHDHEIDAEAEAMEAIERAALARLAIPDPYA